MKRIKTILKGAVLAAALVHAQQVTKPDTFFYHVHFPLAALPTSPTAILAPTNGAAGLTIFGVYVTNTNASTSVTVTLSCTTGGITLAPILLQGYNSQGNNLNVPLPPGGLYCPGGLTGVASGTGINIYAEGKY